jgi:hypothetical protein
MDGEWQMILPRRVFENNGADQRIAAPGRGKFQRSLPRRGRRLNQFYADLFVNIYPYIA